MAFRAITLGRDIEGRRRELSLGLILAVLGARLIRSLLYQVQPLDPAVLVTVATVILGLSLLVSLRPALEATRLDLTRTLREE